MREDDIVFKSLLTQQSVPQPPYSRSGVHNDNLVIFAPYLEARGIATVLEIFIAGNGYRPSRSITPYDHRETSLAAFAGRFTIKAFD
jgi:hypothetical protein